MNFPDCFLMFLIRFVVYVALPLLKGDVFHLNTELKASAELVRTLCDLRIDIAYTTLLL